MDNEFLCITHVKLPTKDLSCWTTELLKWSDFIYSLTERWPAYCFLSSVLGYPSFVLKESSREGKIPHYK